MTVEREGSEHGLRIGERWPEAKGGGRRQHGPDQDRVTGADHKDPIKQGLISSKRMSR